MCHLNHLYHYTSVESLAMILSSQKFRLSPLSILDDLQEEKTRDISEIGKTVFVSSWTSDEKESIPMWNMYSKMESGVRIKSEVNLFEDFKILPDKTLTISDYVHFNSERILFPQELKKVIYSDDESDLFPQIVDDKNQIWNKQKLGVYKNTSWEFQKEWRYIVRVWPGKNFDNENESVDEIYKFFSKSIDKFIYLSIKPEVFKKLEVTLSPKISDGNRIIVNVLKEKYCPTMVIKESSLHNCIR